jgi:hypothetical protein
LTTHARDASERLLRALITIASREQRTHCSDPGLSELWLSDHEPERAEAARLCIGCPVFVPCGQAAAANDERWGVWGGRDRSVRPGRPKKSKDLTGNQEEAASCLGSVPPHPPQPEGMEDGTRSYVSSGQRG